MTKQLHYQWFKKHLMLYNCLWYNASTPLYHKRPIEEIAQ